MLKKALTWILGIFYIWAGWNHFHSHASYVAVMPPHIPYPSLMVDISGYAEMLGGFGALIPPLRKAAGWGLIALLIAVFPANLHMAINHVLPKGLNAPGWALWLRLLFQPPLIWWVWWCCIAGDKKQLSTSTTDLDEPASQVAPKPSTRLM